MQGKSVSPLTLTGRPQFIRWYHAFHSGSRAVLLRQARRGRGPGGPLLRALRARVDLLLQVQQADMSQRLRAEPAHLDVVLEKRARLAQLVGGRREELLLEIEARTRRQD